VGTFLRKPACLNRMGVDKITTMNLTAQVPLAFMAIHAIGTQMTFLTANGIKFGSQGMLVFPKMVMVGGFYRFTVHMTDRTSVWRLNIFFWIIMTIMTGLVDIFLDLGIDRPILTLVFNSRHKIA
jgi:hypothetical protein